MTIDQIERDRMTEDLPNGFADCRLRTLNINYVKEQGRGSNLYL